MAIGLGSPGRPAGKKDNDYIKFIHTEEGRSIKPELKDKNPARKKILCVLV